MHAIYRPLQWVWTIPQAADTQVSSRHAAHNDVLSPDTDTSTTDSYVVAIRVSTSSQLYVT